MTPIQVRAPSLLSADTTGDITDAAFSRDGTMLATTGDDGMLKVWDPETGRLITSETGPGSVEDPSFSGGGALAAAVWNFRTIRFVDLAHGAATRTFRNLNASGDYPVEDAALSADGRMIAVADDDGGVVIMDVSTGDAWSSSMAPNSSTHWPGAPTTDRSPRSDPAA